MKNYWSLSLTLSFLFHALVLTGIPRLASKATPEKEEAAKKPKTREIEISPKNIEKMAKKPLTEPTDLKPLPYVENIISKLMHNDDFSQLQKPQIFEKEVKQIIFTEIPEKIDKALKKNPAYMNYYRLIRERIRNSAYHNYNSKKSGEVLLNFFISKDGALQKVDLNPQSVKNGNLRKIALESVRASAPFPEFPVELQKYTGLQFNISIYFKSN